MEDLVVESEWGLDQLSAYAGNLIDQAMPYIWRMIVNGIMLGMLIIVYAGAGRW